MPRLRRYPANTAVRYQPNRLTCDSNCPFHITRRFLKYINSTVALCIAVQGPDMMKITGINMRTLLLTVLLALSVQQIRAQTPSDSSQARIRLMVTDHFSLAGLLFPVMGTKEIKFSLSTEQTYRDVGMFGRNLRPYLQNDPEALRTLNMYPYMRVGGPLLSVAGFFLAGYVFVANVSTGFEPAHSFLMGAGVVGMIGGIVLHFKADGRIFKAVEIYNRNLHAKKTRVPRR